MLNNLDYTVFTDIKCISYILDQIINNAIKYSKSKGKIEFSAKNIENGVVFSIKNEYTIFNIYFYDISDYLSN